VCGIVGFAGLPRTERDLFRMAASLEHRGPDDGGAYFDVGARPFERVGLAMRRLSIIDLVGGHQPQSNAEGSLWVVFNGEIYNYLELSDELRSLGHRFRTASDTEVLIHLYEEFGLGGLERLQGMFAFALHDRRRGELLLARDRLGIKPLYIWGEHGGLAFGSEAKALLELPDVERAPNLDALDAYLTLRYVPGPQTLFEGIFKLPAGHFLRWRPGRLELRRYWRRPAAGSDELRAWVQRAPGRELVDLFGKTFEEAVRRRMGSDVPVGAYLSGGLDSSAIVAAMARQTSRPVETFSVGFDWTGDELSAAERVARHFDCVHHTVICREPDLELLPRIVWHLDEPVGDAIVLPMFLLSRLAREHVKVVLTGEGADESLAGYLMHKTILWARHIYRRLPGAVRRRLPGVIGRAPPGLLGLGFSYPARLGLEGRRRLRAFVHELESGDLERQYVSLISLFGVEDRVAAFTPALQPRIECWRARTAYDPVDASQVGEMEAVLHSQFAHWLPDDILSKQDRLSMANSVEGRVPFLDHELVELCAALPDSLKLKGWREKVVLRDYLRRVLPSEVSRRSKRPFYVPLDRYLQAPAMRRLLDECLDDGVVERRGIIRPEYVRGLRAGAGGEFLTGKRLFALVVLELWFRIFIDRESGLDFRTDVVELPCVSPRREAGRGGR